MYAAIMRTKRIPLFLFLFAMLSVAFVAQAVNADAHVGKLSSPPVLWTPMQEVRQSMQNITPFIEVTNTTRSILHNRDIILQPHHEKWLFLPARHWLFVETEAQRPFELKIFDAPNIGRISVLPAHAPFVPPENHHRVFAISHINAQPQTIRAFAGQQRQHIPASPLTWEKPLSNPQIVHSITERNFAEYSLANQSKVAISLAPGHYYLLESLLPADTLLNEGRLHQSRWLQTFSGSTQQHSQLAFENRSKKYFIADENQHYLKLEQPILLAPSQQGAKLHYQPFNNELFRLQSLHKDWLFSRNFEQYELPVILAAKQANNNDTKLLNHSLKLSAGQHKHSPQKAVHIDAQKDAFHPNHHRHQSLKLHYLNQHNAIGFLPILPTRSTAQETLQIQYSNAPKQVWKSTINHSPKLTSPNVTTTHPEHQQSRFIVAKPGHKLRFEIPDNLAANILKLELLIRPENLNEESGSNSFKTNLAKQAPTKHVTLTTDKDEQQVFALVSHKNTQAASQSRILIDAWQPIKTNVLTGHPHQTDVTSAVDVFFDTTPEFVELEVSGEQSIPVKLSFPVTITPKLDEYQWQQLFENKHWTNFDWHPEVTRLREYMKHRHAQFIARRNHTFWQTLFSTKQLSQSFPESFPSLTHFEQESDAGPDNVTNKVNTLLQSPKPRDVQYWQALGEALQNEGWHRHKLTLLKMLMLYHPEPSIQKFAFEQLEYEYSTTQNQSALEQLYISLLEGSSNNSNTTDNPLINKNHVLISLAEVFISQGKLKYALLMLTTADHSSLAQQLIFHTATRLGLSKLAKQWGTRERKEEKEIPIHSVMSGQQQTRLGIIPLSSIQHIDSAGAVRFYNSNLNLQSHFLMATQDIPITITPRRAMMLELTARQWFESDTSQAQGDWLEISVNGHHKKVPLFYSNYRSDNFSLENNWAGPAHKIKVAIPKGETLTIKPTFSNVLLNLRELSDINRYSTINTECTHQNYLIVIAEEIQQTANNNTARCHAIHYPSLSLQTSEITDVTPSSGMLEIQKHEQTPTQKISSILDSLYQMETQPASQAPDAMHARINSLIHSLPASAFKTKIATRLNRHTSWERLKTPLSSFGITRIGQPTKDNLPLVSPVLTRKLTLLKQSQSGGDRLTPNAELIYQFIPTSAMPVRFTLGLDEHIFDQIEPAHLSIKETDNKQTVLTLNPGEKKTHITTLEPGEHAVGFAMLNAQPNQNVSLITEYQNTQGEWIRWRPKQTMTAHQASQQSPIQFHFPVPTWLRIDAFDKEQQITSHYRLADTGIFKWYPVNNNDIGYRFFALQKAPVSAVPRSMKTDTVKTSTSNGAATHQLLSSSNASLQAPIKDPANPSVNLLAWTTPPLPSSPAPSSNSNTWQMGVGYDNRFEPDNDTQQQQDFWEVFTVFSEKPGLDHFYQRSLFSIKEHRDLPTSYHAQFSWLDQRQPYALNWRFDTNVNFQPSHHNAPSAWSVGYRLSSDWDYSINRRFFNRWGISAGGNLLHHRDNPDAYFSDVYSDYKASHRFGISISDRLRFKPTHDTELFIEGRLQSNDLGEHLSLDQSRWSGGAKAFYRGWIVEGNFVHRRYYRDNNRLRATDQNIVGVRVDWMLWKKRENWRLRLNYQYDIHTHENAWFINVIWANTSGRGVADYFPTELSFRALRERQFFNAQRHQDTP